MPKTSALVYLRPEDPVEVMRVVDSRQRQTHVERDEMKGAMEDATSVVGNKLESKLELTKPS